MEVQLYVTLLKEQIENVCFDFKSQAQGRVNGEGGGAIWGVPLEDLNLIAHYIFFPASF